MSSLPNQDNSSSLSALYYVYPNQPITSPSDNDVVGCAYQVVTFENQSAAKDLTLPHQRHSLVAVKSKRKISLKKILKISYLFMILYGALSLPISFIILLVGGSPFAFISTVNAFFVLLVGLVSYFTSLYNDKPSLFVLLALFVLFLPSAFIFEIAIYRFPIVSLLLVGCTGIFTTQIYRTIRR